MEKMLTVEMQIAERARKYRSKALTNLHEFINEPLLQESFNTLNKKGASGVDAETWMDLSQTTGKQESFSYYRGPNIRRIIYRKERDPVTTAFFG